MSLRWLHEHEVIAIHGELVAEHGGSPGIRDEGLLSSALARPQQKAAYGDPSVFDLAAAYAFGLIRNHPFIDGNKRAAFVASAVFLRLNGWYLAAAEDEAYSAVLALAQKKMTEPAFAAWLRANCKRRKKSARQ